jgi:hypothetical protein
MRISAIAVFVVLLAGCGSHSGHGGSSPTTTKLCRLGTDFSKLPKC